jgi:hypothetical protein
MAKRYKEVFDPNHSQECICHRGPMNRGLEESPEGDFVDIEDYEELKNQLAKANERVRELEERCSSHEKDMFRQCVFMEKTAEKLEQHREWQATANVLRRPTREAKKAVNKFALENKIEALQELLRRKSHKDVHHLIEIVIDSYKNQLRKEQE